MSHQHHRNRSKQSELRTALIYAGNHTTGILDCPFTHPFTPILAH